MEYYSAIKRWNNAICSNMDATRDYHTKWSKSETERQVPYDITYMWNLKKWYNWTYSQNRGEFPGGAVVKNPPIQGTWVRALVWEDPTCRGATKPMRHNYWACTLEPASHNYWDRMPQPLKPARLETMLRNKREATAMRSLCTATKSSPCLPQLEKACVQQRRPNTDKNK